MEHCSRWDVAAIKIDSTPELHVNTACDEGTIEFREVSQTLDKILAKMDPSLSKAVPSKTAS